jgi:hypothetical protein
VNGVRPEVVRKLVTILSDDGLSGDERIARVFADEDATAAEHYAAARAIAQASVDGLEELGVLTRATPTTALDIRMDDLMVLAAVYEDLRRWNPPPHRDGRRVGDLLKIVPHDVAAWVTRLLRMLGGAS